MKILNRIFPVLILLVIVFCLLEFVVKFNFISSYILPATSDIFMVYFEFKPDILRASYETIQNSLVGFLFAFFVAQVLVLIVSFSELLKKALLPIAVFFQTVPVIAVAPLLVIWFGFGSPTVRASAGLVCFFPLLSSGLTALESVNPDLLELYKSFKAKKWQILFYLKYPAGFKLIINGIQIALGLSVVGAIVGEFIAGTGLGGLIDSARTQQRVDLVFACILLSSVIAYIYLFFLQLIESLLLKWRPFTR